MKRRVALFSQRRRLIDVLCVMAPLALAPAWAQQEDKGESSDQVQEMAIQYRELKLHQEEEAKRRLAIIQMRGEAARLTANTEELNAQAQNCKARRDAYEAGAEVDLCPNDELTVRQGDASSKVIATSQGMDPMLALLETRLEELEARLVEAPLPPVMDHEFGISVSQRTLGTSEAILLLAGPARAVVRLSGGEGDAIYRLPFEARLDGRSCIRTVKALHGIGAGMRICREGATP